MAKEIAIENRRISNFEGLAILKLDRVTLHTTVHHSLTSTHVPNFIEIIETFCRRTDGRTYGWTDGHTDGHLRHTLLGRLRRVTLKRKKQIPHPSQHRAMKSVFLPLPQVFKVTSLQHGQIMYRNHTTYILSGFNSVSYLVVFILYIQDICNVWPVWLT